MKPETFQVLASDLFKGEEKKYGNVQHFDSMSAEDIANYAKAVFVKDEPYVREVFSNTVVLFDTAFATVKEWEFIRHIGIGGSDSAVIEGTSKYGSKLKLYHDKCATPFHMNFDGDKKPIFERGHFLEDNVIQAFCNRTGATRIRDTRMFQSKTHPHCIADIDAMLRMPDGELRLFEAKTTIPENAGAWANGKVPPYYITQTRHYPAVLNDDRIKGTYIGCLFTVDYQFDGFYLGSQYDDQKKFKSQYIERDPMEEAAILDRNEEFWRNYIDAEIEPDPPKNAEKAIEISRMVNGKADPNLPVLDMNSDDNLDKISYYMELKKKIDEIELQKAPFEAEMEEIKAEMIDVLKQHVEGRIKIDDDTYFEVKYTPKKKTVINKEILEAFYPDVYKAVVTVEPEASRVFSVKEKKVKVKK